MAPRLRKMPMRKELVRKELMRKMLALAAQAGPFPWLPRSRRMEALALALTLTALSASLSACSDPGANAPGLGEIMTMTQMRHAKLWLAGEAGNWPLAAYELEELQEGFDDAVKFHPTHKNAPVALSALLPKLMAPPLADLQSAVDAHDASRFEASYDSLTSACNTCHRAMQFGFNVVRRPVGNPYSNQDFQAADGQGAAG